MKDTELYAQILGISRPFTVSRVELAVKKGNVGVWVEHEAGSRFACPECEAICPVYEHAEERTWRHLDTMQLQNLPNILTYYAHRVTNAVSEGINSAIQTIKKRAFGFRNPENFKTAIYFHCGGLELYPALS